MGPVRETEAMIAGMAPILDPTVYYFCIIEDETLLAHALASFREQEGLSVILPEHVVRETGLNAELPMRRITLSVHSALDGVGLTSAVSSVLAEAGIACNMVASYHHDHAFVPVADAEDAMRILHALAGGT